MGGPGRPGKPRCEVERIAAEEGEEPPPVGISVEYREWPALDTMAQLFLTWGSIRWAEVGEHLLDRFEDAGQAEPPRTTASITGISE